MGPNNLHRDDLQTTKQVQVGEAARRQRRRRRRRASDARRHTSRDAFINDQDLAFVCPDGYKQISLCARIYYSLPFSFAPQVPSRHWHINVCHMSSSCLRVVVGRRGDYNVCVFVIHMAFVMRAAGCLARRILAPHASISAPLINLLLLPPPPARLSWPSY